MHGPITASMLYDLVQCPHRVTMDLFADPALKDKISPFVQLLWERGSLYEEEVIEPAFRCLLLIFLTTRVTKKNSKRLTR